MIYHSRLLGNYNFKPALAAAIKGRCSADRNGAHWPAKRTKPTFRHGPRKARDVMDRPKETSLAHTDL